MADDHDALRTNFWLDNLEELDREIARLAVLCGVRLLDPGVMHHVLQKGTSVCRNSNAAAFAKLHGLLMVHLASQSKANDELGEAWTSQIVELIVERLRKSYGNALGEPPA